MESTKKYEQKNETACRSMRMHNGLLHPNVSRKIFRHILYPVKHSNPEPVAFAIPYPAS